MMKTSLGRLPSYETGWRWRLVVAVCLLGGGLSSCGSPVSDQAAGPNSRAATGKTTNVPATGGAEPGAQGTGQMSEAHVRAEPDRSERSDRASAGQPAISDKSAETTDERNAATSSNISENIARDLGSPDAGVRYRALENWETQADQASLTPVLEAMEDEDPAIRAKAATIVERHMDLEKEQVCIQDPSATDGEAHGLDCAN